MAEGTVQHTEPESKTQKVQIKKAMGLPYLTRETVVVDGEEFVVGEEVDLTQEQIKRLKDAGVSLGDSKS